MNECKVGLEKKTTDINVWLEKGLDKLIVYRGIRWIVYIVSMQDQLIRTLFDELESYCVILHNYLIFSRFKK